MIDVEQLEQLAEPDVTPLINVNLVILVMVLAIASHAAKLLPLVMPKAATTAFKEMSEATLLEVGKDGHYALAGRSGLSKEELGEAIHGLGDGSIVLVSMDPKATYDKLVWVVDRMMDKEAPLLQVAFGNPGQPRVKAVTPAEAGKAAATPAPPADKK